MLIKLAAIFVIMTSLFAKANGVCVPALSAPNPRAETFIRAMNAVNFSRKSISRVNNVVSDLEIIKNRTQYAEDAVAKFLTSNGVIFKEAILSEHHAFWKDDKSFTRTLRVGKVEVSPFHRKVFLIQSQGEFANLGILFGRFHNPEFTKNLNIVLDPLGDLAGPQAQFRLKSRAIVLNLLAFTSQFYFSDWDPISHITWDAITEIAQAESLNPRVLPEIFFSVPSLGAELPADQFSLRELFRELSEIKGLGQSLLSFTDFSPGTVGASLRKILMEKLKHFELRSFAARDGLNELAESLNAGAQIQYCKNRDIKAAFVSHQDNLGQKVTAQFDCAFHLGTNVKVIQIEITGALQKLDDIESHVVKLRQDFPNKAPSFLDRVFKKLADKITNKLSPGLNSLQR